MQNQADTLTCLVTNVKVEYHFPWYALFFCLILCLLTGCESSRTIVNGLEEREANEILVFLSSKNIDAAKQPTPAAGGGGGAKIPTYDIVVPSTEATEAMALLNQAGLPRRKTQNLLGIFSNVGLVPSEMQEKIRYQAGLAEQIASTIRKIDGVLDAEVQISFPEEDPLNPGKTKGKITASVYVKHNGVLDDPNSHLITKIKRLVASSVTGLDYDDVTVIPDLARNSDILTGTITGANQEEKQYVSVWTIILAKESLTKFRIVFFSFVLLILILILAIVWLSWKLYPVLQHHGGIKALFHLEPIEPNISETETKAPPVTEEKKDAENKTEDKGLVDKDIDET